MCVQQSTCVQNGLCRIGCVRVTVRAGVNMRTCAGVQFPDGPFKVLSRFYFFRVKFYFSNVCLDVHGFNTNLQEIRMGFIKPGPKILRWIHVRQRQC